MAALATAAAVSLAEGRGYDQDFSDRKSVDGVNVNSDEKLDSIQLEYTYLLTSQLEAQRRWVSIVIRVRGFQLLFPI